MWRSEHFVSELYRSTTGSNDVIFQPFVYDRNKDLEISLNADMLHFLVDYFKKVIESINLTFPGSVEDGFNVELDGDDKLKVTLRCLENGASARTFEEVKENITDGDLYDSKVYYDNSLKTLILVKLQDDSAYVANEIYDLVHVSARVVPNEVPDMAALQAHDDAVMAALQARINALGRDSSSEESNDSETGNESSSEYSSENEVTGR